jgi:small subunit ribosomal protein S17
MSESTPSSPAGGQKTPRAPRAPRTTGTTGTTRTTRTTKTTKAATPETAAPAKPTRARATRGAAAAAAAPKPAPKATRRQQRTGRVVSDKMQKTIVVAVETLKRHPLYKRTYKSTNKFKAHDEHNDARIGDMVRIEETRPLSKDKRWRLVEILRRAAQAPSVEQVVAELEPETGG